LGKLGAAADQRAALGRGFSQALQAKDGNRVVEALQSLSAEFFVVGMARGRLPDLLRRQDFVCSGPVEEPSGEIGRLADHRIFAAPFAADLARDDVPHGERDMHRERAEAALSFLGMSAWISSAARTARSASSPWARGAPNSAIAASPICLSMVPP
jgi:hypothetical protein